MSLNTKKYWLDGIFDDEEYVVPKEDLKPLISEKSLSLTSPVVEEEKEIVVKWSWKEEILCRDYVYRDNVSCKKRHYYKRTISNRMCNKKNLISSQCKKEDKIVLNRTILRFKREGAEIIYR